MNKQIAELAAKSGFDIGIHGGLILGNFSDMYKLDKFAELVVRECMTKLYIKGHDDAVIQLREQFGVEL